MIKYSAADDFIEKLRAQTDIVAIISEYVPLQKKGRNYWGCCPFHQEKTPSFSVAPDKGFFYCFGCQAGGDAFRFLMKIENIGFSEAAKLLAQKLNIPVPERERSEAERQREREREEIFHANALARDFFHACLLKSSLGIYALSYLTNRGVSVEMAQELKLGFAPDDWSKLANALQKRGIRPDVLVKAGLALPRSQDGIYDRFRNRVMFPIEDIRERVIGFGGRVMDDSQPKYLNSPESPVFSKKYVLYNISRAHRAIKEAGRAIVVEGYMDAIALSSQGIHNVVASLGTSFTAEQSRLVRHYASEIVFAYDGDAAGQQATLRALSIVRAGGAEVRVASFPGGKDPDEVMRKYGPKFVTQCLESAAGLLDFQIEQILKNSDFTDLNGKVSVVNQAVPFLAQADNAVEVDAHIARLAERLDIDEGSIRSELRRQRGQKDSTRPSAIYVRRGNDSRQVTAEEYVLRQLLESPEQFATVAATLTPDDFQNGPRRVLAETIWRVAVRDKKICPEKLMAELDEETVQLLSRLLLKEGQGPAVSQALEDCVRIILLARLNTEYEEHRLKADLLLRNGDSQYMQELANAQRILTKISDLTKMQG
ncbi:MAG: DNA primase [Veillonellaceae bacterium]|nr:DNA primase [Veillonellaceae bacterium]